jgi:hypothetical protein
MSNTFVRSIRATGIVACLVGIAIASTSAATASETTNTSACMAFEQSALEDGVEYRLVNHCERRVTCSVQWTLYCGDKPPLRQVKSSSNATLAPSAERSITASAVACAREGWEISKVSWTCAP